MKKISRFAPCLPVLALLCACGGGGGGGDDDTPLSEYASDSIRASQLISQNASLAQTDASAMPSTGYAEYDGIVGMAFGATPESIASAEIIGELDLTANFATNTISGEFDDFDTSSGQALSGQLIVSNGQIVGSDFTADITGTLTGTTNAPGAVSGTIDGDFLGTDHSAISGTGTATSDQGDLGISFTGSLDR